MMLREMLLLLLLMIALVVVSTVGTVRNGSFVGSGSGVGRDGRIALLVRWGSIAACRWIHGLVRLCWTCKGGGGWLSTCSMSLVSTINILLKSSQ